MKKWRNWFSKKEIIPEELANIYMKAATLQLLESIRPKDYNIRFITIYLVIIWIVISILTIAINV